MPHERSIRDRLAWAIHEALSEGPPPGTFTNNFVADAILAACPEIAALDHAREGWLTKDDHTGWTASSRFYGRIAQRVLVVDA
jgi:hypothetical protein